MYKVIGSDNREYGPASEDVIRRWIAEGRANGATQVQKEGDPGWRPLSSCPEFAEALAAGPQTPPPAPAIPAPAPGPTPVPGSSPESSSTPASSSIPGWSSPPGPGSTPAPEPAAAAAAAAALERELLARDVNLDIGACVQRSWELFQKNPWLVVAAWAVAALISTCCMALTVSGLPVSLVVGAVFLAGIHYFFLRLSRGEAASVADVFAGFGPSIGALILCSLVGGILTSIGLALCLIPGLYLLLVWHFAPLLMLEKRLEFWPAMEISRKVANKNFLPILGLAIVALLLCLAGTLLCGIGLFVTGPIATGAVVEAYRKLFEPKPVESIVP